MKCAHVGDIFKEYFFKIRNILRITTKTSNFIVLKRTLSLKNTFLYLAYNKSMNPFFFLPKKGLSATKHIVFKMCFEIFNLLASSKNVIINQLLSLFYR